MAKNKKRPVRRVNKNAIPPKAKTPPVVDEPKEETSPEVPETPEVPESLEMPDNVVPMTTKVKGGPSVIEDPVAVFKFAMLESDLQKNQLEQALISKHADEQIKAATASRDRQLMEKQTLFQKLRVRYIKLVEYIEEKYGMNMKNYTYDDEVGVFKKIKNETDGGEKKEESNG